MKSFSYKIKHPIGNLFDKVYFKKEINIVKWNRQIVYLWVGIAQKCGGGTRLYNEIS